MATFKVGQRVRITRAGVGDPISKPAGSEGTVVALNTNPGGAYLRLYGECHLIAVDGIPSATGGWNVPISCLTPLTDPKADEFIERIKKIAREPAIAPKVTA